MESYKKKSLFALNPALRLANLTVTPTNLEWQVNLDGDGYRRKQTAKAEPNDPTFAL